MTNLLCQIGIHKWSKQKSYNIFSSNVIDFKKYCLRCKKVKKWTKIKTRSLDN